MSRVARLIRWLLKPGVIESLVSLAVVVGVIVAVLKYR